MKLLFPLFILFSVQVNSFSQNLYDPALPDLFDPAMKPFYFSVASGDPLPNSVVIWTKIYPDGDGQQQVKWELASDTTMQNVVQSGEKVVDASSAFTVKIDVKNLGPGTTYFYRFQHNGAYSPVGRTKTAQDGDPSLVRFAVVSCADYQSGFYNAYGHIASRNDIDAVIHLGDYIYEYGAGRARRKKSKLILQQRSHIPDKELHSLQDYRTRYGQYHLDRQLMEVHRLHPFIVIWDDHEIANNSYATGAQNHGANEGDWEQRKAIARQVYFEWLPIRDNPERSIIRKFSFGSLADLWMLDERLEGRSQQVKSMDDPARMSPDRYMLGTRQTDWLLDGMKASKARWKVIGNQVIFTPISDSRVFSRTPAISTDRWDGYPSERKRIFDFFYQNNIRNIVFITGDVHTAWALELTGDPPNPAVYDRKTGKGVIGAEFVSPSVSSFNFDEVIPRFLTLEAKRRFCRKKNNPHLRYLDLVNHGYLLLTLTSERAQADWFFVKRIDRVDDRMKQKGSRFLKWGGQRIEKGK